MSNYTKDVKRILMDNGCWMVRQGRGSHEVWRSPHAENPFTVPSNIKSRHTANGVLRDAGLKKAF